MKLASERGAIYVNGEFIVSPMAIIYDVVGKDVTSENGRLSVGVYMVKTPDNNTTKVLLR